MTLRYPPGRGNPCAGAPCCLPDGVTLPELLGTVQQSVSLYGVTLMPPALGLSVESVDSIWPRDAAPKRVVLSNVIVKLDKQIPEKDMDTMWRNLLRVRDELVFHVVGRLYRHTETNNQKLGESLRLAIKAAHCLPNRMEVTVDCHWTQSTVPAVLWSRHHDRHCGCCTGKECKPLHTP